MKKNFAAGLAILLPIALTFWILMFIVNLLTSPFLGITQEILQAHEISVLVSKLLILLVLVLLIFIAGFLGRVFFINTIFAWGDKLIHRIPLVNKVYKSLQDAIHTMFHRETTPFSQVVLIPFPHSKAWCLGMITSSSLPGATDTRLTDRVSVFVPGTPNPTVGFMLMYRKEELVYLNLKVEDAVKFIISCGVISDPLRATSVMNQKF